MSAPSGVAAPSTPSVGWLAAFGLLFVWSGWVVISRLGVIQTLTVYDMIFLRFTVSGLVMAPFAWHYWPRHIAWWKLCLFSVTTGVPHLMFSFTGMTFAPASHAGILMNGTMPIFAALIAWWWLKDRPPVWKGVGMIIILSGCVLIGLDQSSGGVGPDAWIGHLCFMASALLLASYMVGTRVLGVTAMQVLVSIPLINLAWYIPLYVMFLPKAIDVAPMSEILLQGLYQGFGPGILGITLFTIAIRTIGSTPTAAVMAWVPGMAAILGIPLLGEWPSELAWVGLLVVTAGILITVTNLPGSWRRWLRAL